MPAVKRSAETQLTRGHEEDDDDVMEVTPGEGFKRADQSVLASRPMKGLPKRSNAMAATYDAPDSKRLVPKFGVPSQTFAAPSSAFTFTASASSQATTRPPISNPPFKFAAPTVSPSATSASKQLASILDSAPQSNGSHTSATGEDSPESFDEALKYYAACRALNLDFLKDVEEALEKNFDVDLRPWHDQYAEYRSSIEKEFIESQKKSRASVSNGTSSAPSASSAVGSSASSSTPLAANGLSMPKPPKAFSGFGSSAAGDPSTSTSSPPVGGGFRPNLDAASTSATPSVFKFGSPSTTEEKDTPTGSPFGATGSSQSPFGASSNTLNPSPFGGASSSPFQFGSSTSSADKSSSPFGSGSAFGGVTPFGKSIGSSNSTATLSNPFGNNGTSSPSASTSAFGGTGTGQAVFGVGAVRPSGGSGSAGGSAFDGKSTMSTSEDVKHSTGDADNKPVASSSKTSSPFGPLPSKSPFGAVANVTGSGSQEVASTLSKPNTSTLESTSNVPASTEGGEAPAEGTSLPNLLGDRPHDLEGEGEENEITVHGERAKIFRLGKQDDRPAWIDIGVGVLRLKKHKENGILRLLCRNTGTGKIIMNFKLYHGFKTSRTKQILSFIGHENTDRVSFRIRFKEESAAIAIHEAIENAVSSLEA